jgi:capsular polysaccharide biosynthesis protein
MKKFSRCALILIIVTLLGAIGGYVFENSTTTPVYSSTARVIVTPGEKNEASVRATDGGLVKDFEVVFASSTVISAAQKTAGTSEDIGQYLTVNTVPNSNIVELTVTNPDQTTAKNYVDAVAKNVSKTTSILTVESIQVLEYGDESNIAFKPDVLKNAGIIAAIVAAICLVVELIIIFVLSAFKDDDDSDDELAYERRYGMVPAGYMLAYNKEEINHARLNSEDDDDEDDDEEDEDEKFNKAIGVDAYKEELGKLGGDDTKKNKKKAKKAEEAEPVYESDVEEEEIEDDSDEESVVDNVVAFGTSYANADDDEDLDDEYYDEDEEDDDEEAPVMASVASFEAAAAKEAEIREAEIKEPEIKKSETNEPETNEPETKESETNETEINEAEAEKSDMWKKGTVGESKKTEKADKKAMKSSAEVLATIKK